MGLEERVCIVRILVAMDDLPSPHLDPHSRARLEPACQGPRHEEVEEGSQGAALPDARIVAHHPGDVAVDICGRRCVSQHDPRPREEACTRPHCLHDRQEERPGDRVVGFAEVQEGHGDGGGEAIGEGSVATKLLREELEECDIVTDEPPREEGCLLRPDGGRQHRPHAGRQNLGEEAVVGVKEGNGAVVGRVGSVACLVKGVDDAVEEAGRDRPYSANGAVDGGEDRGQQPDVVAPELHGEAIRARGLPRSAALDHRRYRGCHDVGCPRLLCSGWGYGDCVEPHGIQDLLYSCCILGRGGRDPSPEFRHVLGHEGAVCEKASSR
jgi:hypothetical protein